MNFDFLDSLGWRDVLVALVVLLALYILTTFLRMSRLRSEHLRTRELPFGVIQEAAESHAAPRKQEVQAELDLEFRPARSEAPPECPESPRIALLEEDVAQLRREIGGLRAEMQALRDAQEREMSREPFAQNVSPFYSDAMQLAAQGGDASDISAKCGISRAEAELVVALAKNGSRLGMAVEPER